MAKRQKPLSQAAALALHKKRPALKRAFARQLKAHVEASLEAGAYSEDVIVVLRAQADAVRKAWGNPTD